MMEITTPTRTRDIVVQEDFPHTPATIWKTITSGALMSRWLMTPTGFVPEVGNRFTFQTMAAGPWDGTIRCEVLEVVQEERFVFSWRGGHPENVGYGSPLDTVVSWTLQQLPDGTRVRLVHAGFIAPTNDHAYGKMSQGWIGVVDKVRTLSGADDPQTHATPTKGT